MGAKVFECQKCGHCCEGRGGIVLEEGELERIAQFLEQAPQDVRNEYCVVSGGKWKLGIGKDGFCVFFRREQGCGIHEVKPNVCRAWPFFRGNLVDETSMRMAADFCPGIIEKEYEKFQEFGLNYLNKNHLVSKDGIANALNLPETLYGSSGRE